MKIYVVEGKTGEFSDHREWPVKAFVSEERAKEFVAEVSLLAKVIFENWNRNYFDMERGINPLDPMMEIDYTGVDYYYYEVELDEE